MLTRVSVLTSSSEETRRGIVLPFYSQGAQPIPHCACSEWSDADPLGVTAWLDFVEGSPRPGHEAFRFQVRAERFRIPPTWNEACRFQVRAERFSAAKDHILRLTYCRGVDGLPEVERSHAHFRHRITLPQSGSCMAFCRSGLARSAVTPGPRLVTDQRAKQNLNIDSPCPDYRISCQRHYRRRPRRLSMPPSTAHSLSRLKQGQTLRNATPSALP